MKEKLRGRKEGRKELLGLESENLGSDWGPLLHVVCSRTQTLLRIMSSKSQAEKEKQGFLAQATGIRSQG